jgi:uncharacterized protein (TIGR02145 family)
MKRLITGLFSILICLSVCAQFKKKRIEILQNSIDSLNIVVINEEIAQQQRLKEFNVKLFDLDTKINKLKNQISGLNDNLTDLKKELSIIEISIIERQNKITELLSQIQFKSDSLLLLNVEYAKIKPTQKLIKNDNSLNQIGNYKSVKIGTQIWMTENLNISKFRNGNLIPFAETAEEWLDAGKRKQPAWCFYQNDQDNGPKYGKLYNWYAVIDPRGLAPDGWHIPSKLEWEQLVHELGGEHAAGKKMKDQNGWKNNNNGTNQSGFSAQPAGIRGGEEIFVGEGFGGSWWSTTEITDNSAWALLIDKGNGVGGVPFDEMLGFSVRCMKNSESQVIHNIIKDNDLIIGEQIWMTENLNVSTFRNGDLIQEAKTDQEWKSAAENMQPAWCYSENSNGKQFAKLYNYYAITDPRGLAPFGWHIPSDYEWTVLTDYLGGSTKAGLKMKSRERWSSEDKQDFYTNESGFSAQPCGRRIFNGIFDRVDDSGYWWSSSSANAWNIGFYSSFVSPQAQDSGNGCSVRCIKD